ncbi:XRE family transcriptional regulator [Paludicola sp. MB14-C6]|uniref:helix-turn-helix domain-containing protein n=1 Tax=Paludihabitans sp. MB14-C6 TaxID=3070656 RepID=UPI0027DE89CE|nr:XRE family transcriptional regulator [Paludicola sp. MB14-C6]WMJ23694.1 XRE family transcriptional regulator [Paludicola sp. MB14-C6]
MESRIVEVAQRIKTLREILDISVEEMAACLDVSNEEYLSYENGDNDFSFTFLHKCAQKFNVDIVELLTGENPRLSFFTVTRKDHGLNINRRMGFHYQHMAHNFKGKMAEPFIVEAPYSEEAQNQQIELSTHEGQEFDLVLEGSLKVRMENHILILNEGDAIMYDSGHGHGMIATNGQPCKFLAVVIKK